MYWQGFEASCTCFREAMLQAIKGYQQRRGGSRPTLLFMRTKCGSGRPAMLMRQRLVDALKDKGALLVTTVSFFAPHGLLTYHLLPSCSSCK